MLKPDATGPAPGVAAGQPSPVRVSGKVGPGGKVIDQDAPSIAGWACQGYGRGYRATRARWDCWKGAAQRATGAGWGGRSDADEPTSRTRRTPRRVSPPRKRARQRSWPGNSRQRSPASAATAVRWRMSPSREVAFRCSSIRRLARSRSRPTLSCRSWISRIRQPMCRSDSLKWWSVPALVGGGMMVDVPASLFPVVTAAIGADGKVTIGERQRLAGDKDDKDAVSQGRTGAQQSLRSEAAQQSERLGPTADQSLRSESAQRLGPGGDQNVGLELPPPADVTVTIVNLDGAGEGFNDATAVAPVFGNPGTTRGAQRLNAFRAAAEYWGGILKSSVPIQVDAKMDPQTCTATSAVLGSAGPTTAHRDFAGAPVAATWYVQATANSRAGVDLSAANSDISATFNSDVDNPTCLGATSWWYGIGAPAPAGTIDFYTVVLHEIGHGIGVLSLVNLSTGAKLGGFDDAYERWLWDWTTGGWPGMTDAQRLASAINTGQVIFWGPRATEAGRGFLSAGLNGSYPRVFAPNPVQGGSSISHFDTVLTPNELMEPAVTPPPGPYAYFTSGLLQDIGWRLLANGVFDFGAAGTWTWNPTDGWAQPTTA